MPLTQALAELETDSLIKIDVPCLTPDRLKQPIIALEYYPIHPIAH